MIMYLCVNQIYVCLCMYVCRQAYMSPYMYICMCVDTFVCMCEWMDVHRHVCLYAWI